MVPVLGVGVLTTVKVVLPEALETTFDFREIRSDTVLSVTVYVS